MAFTFEQLSNNPPDPPDPSPAQLALINWHNQVALLEPWEREEVQTVYLILNSLLKTYQSSAGLALLRASLEVGLLNGQ